MVGMPKGGILRYHREVFDLDKGKMSSTLCVAVRGESFLGEPKSVKAIRTTTLPKQRFRNFGEDLCQNE